MHQSVSLKLFPVVVIFLRSLGVICYDRWIVSDSHRNYFKEWCLMNSQLTFLLLTSFIPSHPSISESCIKIKIRLNFYFHTSLWCLKRFYEGCSNIILRVGGTCRKCVWCNIMQIKYLELLTVSDKILLPRACCCHKI